MGASVHTLSTPGTSNELHLQLRCSCLLWCESICYWCHPLIIFHSCFQYPAFFFMRVCFHLLCALICVHVCANIGCANTSARPRVCRPLYYMFVLLCGRSSLDVSLSETRDLIQISESRSNSDYTLSVLVDAVSNNDKRNKTLFWATGEKNKVPIITNNTITRWCWNVNYVV